MTETIPSDRLLKPAEVASRLSVSKTSVYHLIRRGDLPAVKVLADLRVPATAVANYILSLSTKGE